MTGILMVQGLRCTGCRLIFHKDCANFATKIPCTTPLTSPNPVYKMSEAGRRPWERMSFKSPRLSLASTYHGPLFGAGFTAIPSFNLTKTKQQTDSTALLIESIDDLREFSVFIFKKQSHLGQQNKRETVVDAIFKRALREGSTTLKYHDLIRTFEGLLTKICNEEKLTFPTTLGVNAFRGFLNEFMEQRKRRSSSKKSSIIKAILQL
ncbi:unnamed protein product [Meloidogyne enterolobii]|uniref:Uncharacterized protein n=1 Tax=Meloidogyne enterolobii TaxID=390850 RepID=A0ACB0ZZ74_MELEN